MSDALDTLCLGREGEEKKDAVNVNFDSVGNLLKEIEKNCKTFQHLLSSANFSKDKGCGITVTKFLGANNALSIGEVSYHINGSKTRRAIKLVDTPKISKFLLILIISLLWLYRTISIQRLLIILGIRLLLVW